MISHGLAMVRGRQDPRGEPRDTGTLFSRSAMWAILLSAAATGLSPCASGDVTLEEARAVAECMAGHSLAAAEASVEEAYGARIAVFAERVGPTTVHHYKVGLEAARVATWHRIDDPPLPIEGDPAITLDEAIAKASALAHRFMGTDADHLRWAISSWRGGIAVLDGEAPLVGDPPRRGLSPRCRVRINLPTGEPVECAPLAWSREAPIPVNLSREDAIEAARRELHAPDEATVKDCVLVQGEGKASWVVYLTDGHHFQGTIVDAVTGQCRNSGGTGPLGPTETMERPDALTADEAVTLARRCGVNMTDAPPWIVRHDGHLAFVTGTDSEGMPIDVAVDLTRGRVRGWVHPERTGRGDASQASPDEAGFAAARRAAATWMSAAAASTLTWHVAGSAPAGRLLYGRGPAQGDPPRFGLTPECRAWVDLVTGRLLWYDQDIPEFEAAPPPRVTRDQAATLAVYNAGLVSSLDYGPWELDEEPYLYQYDESRMSWGVRLRSLRPANPRLGMPTVGTILREVAADSGIVHDPTSALIGRAGFLSRILYDQRRLAVLMLPTARRLAEKTGILGDIAQWNTVLRVAGSRGGYTDLEAAFWTGTDVERAPRVVVRMQGVRLRALAVPTPPPGAAPIEPAEALARAKDAAMEYVPELVEALTWSAPEVRGSVLRVAGIITQPEQQAGAGGQRGGLLGGEGRMHAVTPGCYVDVDRPSGHVIALRVVYPDDVVFPESM